MVVLRNAFFILTIALPLNTSAALIINEIAWMGTDESANDEWIELYNDDAAQNVNGWMLHDSAGLEIELSGTVPAGGYVVLERTDDSSAPGDAFLIYTGALANDGRTLVLERSDGTIEDQVAGGGDWQNIGGDNESKETAQYTGSGWVTAAPTPGGQNASVSSDTTPDSEDDETGTSTDTVEKETDEKEGSDDNVHISLEVPDSELSLELITPEVGYVNQPVNFDVDASGIGDKLIDSLLYRWNFGDMHVATGKEVTHTFTHPGSYVVVVEATYARHTARERREITILPTTFSITRAENGDIQIHNDAKYEVDISGFSARADSEVVVPDHTILLPNATLTIPKDMIERGTQKTVAFYDTAGHMIAYYLSAHSRVAEAETVSATDASFDPAKSAASNDEGEILETQAEASSSMSVNTFNRPAPLVPDRQEAAVVGSFVPGERMPYLALMGVMMLGVLAIYTRKMI